MKTKLFIGAGLIAVLGVSAYTLFDGGIAGLASVITSQNRIIYAECISTFSEASHNNFAIREADLNGDGRQDAIVEQTNSASCGTAGCVFEICVSSTTHTFTHVPFGYAARDVTVQETKTNNMSDLLLNDDEDLKMIWNGFRYVLED